MKRIDALVILLCMGWAGCSWSTPDRAASVALGSEFTLPVGGVAQVGTAGLHLGVEAIRADSRCPKAAQCVWAGEAIVRVWLQQGRADRQVLDVHLPAIAGLPAQALGYQVSLLRLDPVPLSDKPIAQTDYRVRLRLELAPQRTSTGASDR